MPTKKYSIIFINPKMLADKTAYNMNCVKNQFFLTV